MANLITGLFDTEAAAENAVSQLKAMGYGSNEITIVMRDRGAAATLATDTGSRTLEGVGEGAVIGGVIGAVLGGLLAIGSVVIPGVGLIAAGPLAAMWAGAGMGGLAGSVIGWLVGAGIPEDVAPYYERGLAAGGVVVAVACHPGDEARVQNVLQGGAVAYAGARGTNIPSWVSPTYAARYSDITPPPKLASPGMEPTLAPPATMPGMDTRNDDRMTNPRTYDTDSTTGYTTPTVSNEPARSANSVAAEQRAAERTADEHMREARRDAETTNPVTGAANAARNEWDRTRTAAENQADKVSTGTQNEVDRIGNP